MPRASSGAPHSDSSSGDLVIAFGFWLFAFFATGPAPQALNFQGRAPRAEEARVLYWNWPARLLLGWVPVGTRPAPQGQLVAPQAENFRGGSGGGQFGGQRGDLGRKCRFWYHPATPASRREEHFGIWEVGSIRPSRGGEGGACRLPGSPHLAVVGGASLRALLPLVTGMCVVSD